MILTSEDTLYAYDKIHQAYDGVERIDDYFRMKKMERINKIPTPLFGMRWEDAVQTCKIRKKKQKNWPNT